MLNAVSKLFPLPWPSEPQSSSNHCGTVFCAPTCVSRRRCLCYLRAMSSVKRSGPRLSSSRDGGGGGSTRRARRRRKRRRKEGRKGTGKRTERALGRPSKRRKGELRTQPNWISIRKGGWFFGLAVSIEVDDTKWMALTLPFYDVAWKS